MSNIFYNPSGNPGTASEGLSSLIRAEFVAIGQAFDMVPQISTTGLYATVFNQQGNYTFTLPSSPGTLALTADVATETTRATAAEGVLTTAVSTEATARAAGDTTETTRATTAEALLAPKASPALTGTPTAPTASPGTNTTQLATTAYVQAAATALTTGVASVNTRTGAIVLALADIPGAAPLASPTLTGTPVAPTAAPGTNTTQLATTAFDTAAVLVETTRATTAEALLAPKASPALTGTPTGPTASTSTNTTQLATTAFVQTAVAPAFDNVGRNLFHNAMDRVQQRGTGPWTTTFAYTSDRWFIETGTGGGSRSATIATLSDTARTAIGDEEAAYGLQYVFSGGSAAGDYDLLAQRLESVRRTAGKTVTVSFWAVAASGTPKIGVALQQYFGTGGSPSGVVLIAAQTVTLSTTWARYSVTFSVPSIIGKTLGTSGTDTLEVDFWLSSGATFNSQAGTIGVQSGTITTFGRQIEIGSVATPLEKPDIRYDLANCQRFYWATNTIVSAGGSNPVGTQITSYMTVPFPVTMRGVPTLTPTWGTATNVNAASLINVGTSSAQISVQGAGGGSFQYAFQALNSLTASADL